MQRKGIKSGERHSVKKMGGVGIVAKVMFEQRFEGGEGGGLGGAQEEDSRQRKQLEQRLTCEYVPGVSC